MPWEWIVDSTRAEQGVATWADPAAYARAVQHSYRRNKWLDQPTHISVWSEKATVEGTIRPVLEQNEGSSRNRVGNFHSSGSMQVRIFSRKYSSSR